MLQIFMSNVNIELLVNRILSKKKKEKVPCNLTLVVAKERAQVARIAGLAK